MPNASTQTNKSYSKYIKRTKWKKKYNKKAKIYKVSIAKLADKKINTLLEKRILEIAQDQKATLISRRYFGPSNANHNLFGSGTNDDIDPQSNSWRYTRFKRITSEPTIYTLTAIAKSDINQPLNNPIDPNDQDGVTQGMITESMHGKRQGNIIKIKGISVEFRLDHDFGLNDVTAFQGNIPPLPDIARRKIRDFIINTGGKCTFYWKVIEVPSRPNPIVLPLDKYEGARACMMNEVLPFGYSASLDKDIQSESRRLKYKVLLQGQTDLNIPIKLTTASSVLHNFPIHEITPRKKTISKYVRFAKPITIVYAPTDQDGIEAENKIIYLVVKTDIMTEGNDPMDQTVAPLMSCCSKVYYTEP